MEYHGGKLTRSLCLSAHATEWLRHKRCHLELWEMFDLSACLGSARDSGKHFFIQWNPGMRGGGNPNMKGVGMLVVSLRGVNFGFWSHLGCSGQNAFIFSREGTIQGKPPSALCRDGWSVCAGKFAKKCSKHGKKSAQIVLEL